MKAFFPMKSEFTLRKIENGIIATLFDSPKEYCYKNMKEFITDKLGKSTQETFENMLEDGKIKVTIIVEMDDSKDVTT